MRRSRQSYPLLRVECRDFTDRARGFDARPGHGGAEFRCCKCGELVAITGNEIHSVKRLSRAEAAE